MRTVAEFRTWAGRQWRNHWPSWLAASVSSAADPDAATRPPWLPLQPPTAAAMARDPEAVARWVQEWQHFEETEGVELTWVNKRWAAFGAHRLPERASGPPDLLAQLAGHEETWRRGADTAGRLVAAWPDTDLGAAVRSTASGLGRLDEADAVRLLAVLAWLAAHPESGLWERELPVADVHTKWLERHRATVEGLISAITGNDGTGLRRTAVRFRVRVLDPALPVPVKDFSLDLPALQRLDMAPAVVLICENATILSTLPCLPGAVAIHGMGFAAPTLAEAGWLRSAEQWYWGDLDTWGFMILGQLRAALPGVRSVLMNAATWHEHAFFRVVEPRPFRGEIGYLTAAERDALALVRAVSGRLEQERIPREAAEAALRAVLT